MGKALEALAASFFLPKRWRKLQQSQFSNMLLMFIEWLLPVLPFLDVPDQDKPPLRFVEISATASSISTACRSCGPSLACPHGSCNDFDITTDAGYTRLVQIALRLEVGAFAWFRVPDHTWLRHQTAYQRQKYPLGDLDNGEVRVENLRMQRSCVLATLLWLRGAPQGENSGVGVFGRCFGVPRPMSHVARPNSVAPSQVHSAWEFRPQSLAPKTPFFEKIRELAMIGKFCVVHPVSGPSLQRFDVYSTSHQIKRMQGNMQMLGKTIPSYSTYGAFAEDVATVVTASFAQDPVAGDIEAHFGWRQEASFAFLQLILHQFLPRSSCSPDPLSPLRVGSGGKLDKSLDKSQQDSPSESPMKSSECSAEKRRRVSHKTQDIEGAVSVPSSEKGSSPEPAAPPTPEPAAPPTPEAPSATAAPSTATYSSSASSTAAPSTARHSSTSPTPSAPRRSRPPAAEDPSDWSNRELMMLARLIKYGN